MKKSERMDAIIAGLDLPGDVLPREYLGWFACFNRAEYYEAHDVLEHLWLRTTGPEALFFKALIQLAGAFVHLRLHRLAPDHHVHGRRLRPAARLLRLTAKNLAPYAPATLRLDVAATIALAEAWAEKIERTNFTANPWTPAEAPQIPPP